MLALFPDNGFDAVYYSAVFHWIDDNKVALREACRVLRPGGTIGIYTGCRGDRTSTMGFLRQIAGEHASGWPDKKEGRARMWLAKDEMEALLAEAGFVDIIVEHRQEIKFFRSADDYFLWLRASSFGRQSRLGPHPVRSPPQDGGGAGRAQNAAGHRDPVEHPVRHRLSAPLIFRAATDRVCFDSI